MTPQGFPLRPLIDKILELMEGRVSFRVFSAWGYGKNVFNLYERTDEEKWVDVLPENFLPLSEGIEEWFYDLTLEIRNSTQTIVCGIHDSSMMFIEGDSELVEAVVAQYSDVEQYLRSKLNTKK